MKRIIYIAVIGLTALLLAGWGLNCGGDKADDGQFDGREPIWEDKNTGPANSLNTCNDGKDNDGDGLADYNGQPPGCSGPPCIYEPDPECNVAGSTGEAACSDNLDNDGDTFFDKADAGCHFCGNYVPFRNSELVFISECCDGIDNDCDGDYDMADQECQDGLGSEGTMQIQECNDGTDNDTDTFIDLADPQCGGDICGNES